MHEKETFDVIPYFIYLIIFFIDFYIIWPIFYNEILPVIKKLTLWQKSLIFIIINAGISLGVTYGFYQVSEFIYNEFIIN